MVPEFSTKTSTADREGPAYSSMRFLFPFRAAVAAAEAFFARAARSSGVMDAAAFFPPALPPIFPPFAPCLRKNSKTSGGSFFFAMTQS